MPPPVFRFAPSPNGYLHLGHACSALLNFDLARQSAGRFLLRIEDIDATRCRPEFEAAIYEDLAWLGIGWEEPVRRQSGAPDRNSVAPNRHGQDAGSHSGLAQIGKRVAASCRSRHARACPGHDVFGAS